MLKTYNSWNDVPSNLGTQTGLRREGLRLAPGQRTVARKRGMRGYYALYDKGAALPARKLTDAQAAALAKARTVVCAGCGTRGRLTELNGDKFCDRCYIDRQERDANLLAYQQSVEWARRVLAEKGRHVILDTETTGLELEDQVIQLAIIDLAGNELFNSLLRPTVPVSDGAFAVHLISSEQLLSAPALPDVLPRLYVGLDGKDYNYQVRHSTVNEYSDKVTCRHCFAIWNEARLYGRSDFSIPEI